MSFGLSLAFDQVRVVISVCKSHVVDNKRSFYFRKNFFTKAFNLAFGHKASMCQFTMEYSIIVLLLMSSAVVVNSQGYHSNFNNRTISTAPRRSSRENLIYHNDIIERSRHKLYNEQQFEKIFDHYQSDRREPRFISFQTKDDNIEVEIDFAIPFLSIPVRRSLSGAMGTLQNVIKVISCHIHKKI
jgi:hypothetical protein